MDYLKDIKGGGGEVAALVETPEPPEPPEPAVGGVGGAATPSPVDWLVGATATWACSCRSPPP